MQTIRVAQIVDSLTPGGTESVAVNLANDLAAAPGFQSYLICSRAEGGLKQRIQSDVTYYFLDKGSSYDIKGLRRLLQFIRKHKIMVVHAHSTSFYFPVLIKWLCRFKLVWHDHYGVDVPPDGKRPYPYIPFSRFFDYAISVNDRLLQNNLKHLQVSPAHQSYLPNYSVSLPVAAWPIMKGLKEQRLICLANLRPQKDHFTLLKAFRIVIDSYPNAVLYCVGVLDGNEYEKEVRQLAKESGIENNVVFTGTVANPFAYLLQSAIGILSSLSEGLPLSLIEYGLAGLPVICTNVGQCAELLENGKNGLLVPPQHAEALAIACLQLLEDEEQRNNYRTGFAVYVRNHYSKTAILHRLLSIYKSL